MERRLYWVEVWAQDGSRIGATEVIVDAARGKIPLAEIATSGISLLQAQHDLKPTDRFAVSGCIHLPDFEHAERIGEDWL